MGDWSALTSLGYVMAMWIILTVAHGFKDRLTGAGKKGSLWQRLTKPSRSFYGMQFAHLGVAVFIIGVTSVESYDQEKDVRMDVGDTLTLNEYTFKFEGVTQEPGPNYTANKGHIQVLKNGEDYMMLYPEKRTYLVQTMPMTEAAIDTGLTRDLYVSLGEPVSGNAWSVRVYVKPFVDWIWFGCVFMGIGGILSVSDRRYRIVLRSKKAVEKAESDKGKPVLATE
jgi:cytochrome c-type biogenesis protein CcmF